jgi:hypothetical protein
MKPYFSLLIVLLLSIVSFNLQAATGCLSSSTTYTYINPEGINRNGVPSYYHRYESDRLLSTQTYCVVNTGAGCYIYSTRSGYSSSPGTIVQYNPINNCPIDDYAGLILAGFAVIGFVYIRKRGNISYTL